MRSHSIIAGGFAAALLLSVAPVSAQPVIGGPFSGLYLGGNAGVAFDPNHLSFTDRTGAGALSFDSRDNNDRFVGGAHLGYNWQPGGILFGVEGDSDFGKDIDYLASLRGRVGITTGPFLIYGTGGAAWEGSHEHFNVSSAAGNASFDRNIKKTGWVAGGGVEAFVMPAVSVGAEGLYYHFGEDTANLATPVPENFSVKDDRNFPLVRARLTYHFGF
ncbi:MAG: porin family protein [Alphaproteobacteria bacterium]|nr:porin family protein [Alphaproteobacteria bacterium]